MTRQAKDEGRSAEMTDGRRDTMDGADYVHSLHIRPHPFSSLSRYYRPALRSSTRLGHSLLRSFPRLIPARGRP